MYKYLCCVLSLSDSKIVLLYIIYVMGRCILFKMFYCINSFSNVILIGRGYQKIREKFKNGYRTTYNINGFKTILEGI